MDATIAPPATNPTAHATPLRRLTCSVCGEDAGRHHQHWNRDHGFGICRRCVDWLIGRGVTADELARCYGVEGLNYAPKGA